MTTRAQPLIFNVNLLEEAVTKTASSEDTSYPATNVYNIERRRLTWRSKGYWNIESGANTILFNEGGSDLTATIAVAEYATDALFLAAIATAFNGAASKQNTYSVSRDVSTGKIKLTAVLAGTGTIFTIKWTSADDFGTIIGFDTSADDTGSLVYTADLLRIHTEEFFIFDLGVPGQPTGFAAVNDRNVALNISPSATVRLMGNPTNSWASPAETFTITLRDFVLGYVNIDGIAQLQTAGYRWWKFQIIDNDNPDQYLELGAMALMSHAVMERGCPSFPLTARDQDLSRVDYSESGQSWISKRPKTRLHTLSWEKLTNADADLLQDFWEEYGLHNSFFVCLDPLSAFSPDGLKWIRLVKFAEPPTLQLVKPAVWTYDWQLREEL